MTFTEHKTVQALIIQYAQEIGWTYVPRDEAERRRRFTPHPNPLPQGERENPVRTRKASLFFGDLIDWLMTAKIRGQDLPKLGVKESVKWRHVSGSRDQ